MAETMLIPRIAALYELQSAYLEPRLKKLGISLSTFQLLAVVHSSGGEASQIEIARRLGVSPATLSETVHLHIKKGLLEQVVSSEDRRVKILKLTKSSSSKLKDVRKLLDNLEEIMLKDVSGSTFRSALAVLDLALANVENRLKS